MKAMIVYGIALGMMVVSFHYFLNCEDIEIMKERNTEIEQSVDALFN